MNGFWNKLGNKYLNGIQEGLLEVTYPDGTTISMVMVMNQKQTYNLKTEHFLNACHSMVT